MRDRAPEASAPDPSEQEPLQETRTATGGSETSATPRYARSLKTEPVRTDGMPAIPGVVEMEPLGKGGMGVVFKGTQDKLDRTVAIKVLGHEYRTPQAEKRFLRECKHLARLDHVNIVRCFDSGVTDDGEPYMVMEFVDGPNLSKWTSAHGPLSIVDALRVCLDLTDALEHGLDRKLVHRDVKPENVLLKPDQRPRSGSFPFQVKLADFGLSRSDREDLGEVRVTQPGEAWGSPPTMAPEQFVMFGSVDFRADLYALGCILHFTLTGKHAYTERTWKLLHEAKQKGPPPDARKLRADIPEAVAHLVRDMLQPDPRDRPHSYAVVSRRLDEILAQLDPAFAPRPKRARRHAAVRWTGAAVAVATISAAVAWSVMRYGRADEVSHVADSVVLAPSPGARDDKLKPADPPPPKDDGKVPPIAVRAHAPMVELARNEVTVKAGGRAFLKSEGSDPQFSTDQLSFAWKLVQPADLALELEGRDTPTLTFWAPEPPEGRDYDIVLEVVAENARHVASDPARVTVHVSADEKTKPLDPGQSIALFRSEEAFHQAWTSASGSEKAFTWNDEGSLHGNSSSGRKRIELELPRGAWKLAGKVRLERGPAPAVTRGRVSLEALGAEVAIELEATQDDARSKQSRLSFRGFGERVPRSGPIADTDYVTFEAVWNGKTLVVTHGREDLASKRTGPSALPAAFDAEVTGRPVKLCLEVEGSELVLRDFVLSSRDP